jgi:hypothetical protein
VSGLSVRLAQPNRGGVGHSCGPMESQPRALAPRSASALWKGMTLSSGWPCRSPGQSAAVSANPLFINGYDFLRDVTSIAASYRPNHRNRLSFPKGLHLFRHHASRFGSGQSTAAGNAHQTECYDALRFQRQHDRLRRYGKPVVPDSERVAHCIFSNPRSQPPQPLELSQGPGLMHRGKQRPGDFSQTR